MKILAIYYSQSGQLNEIIKNFVSPIQDAEIDFVQYRPKIDFPFPWTSEVFYNAMPESVMEVPVELEEISYKEEKYDLIIIGYQPWFLSPSIPTTSLLKDEKFIKIMKNTPIITVIGSRNMWLNAQEGVKKMIQDAGGKLVGNVPLIDKNPNLISAVSIVHWMLTGKKERKFGIFPTPGISQEDIENVSEYGKMLNNALKRNELENFQTEFRAAGGVNINTNILFIEGKAKRIFRIWASLIKRNELKGKRKRWVKFFKNYLLIALFGVSPILLTFYNILIRPFTGRSIKQKKEYFYSTELKNK
jgi:hypothetical protein